MGMKAMYQLKDMLCREVDEIAEKGELSPGDLDTAWKLTGTIKNIQKIKMLDQAEQYSGEGYGQYSGYDMDDGMPMSNRGYGRAGYGRAGYERGNSYRGRNAMGRFTSRDDGTMQFASQMEEVINSGHFDKRQQDAIREALDMVKG